MNNYSRIRDLMALMDERKLGIAPHEELQLRLMHEIMEHLDCVQAELASIDKTLTEHFDNE